MKTNKMILLLVSVFIWQYSFGDNESSPHELSSDDWENNIDKCKICHSLEMKNGLSFKPLWGGTMSFKTYVLYKSATLDALVYQPDGVSLLCLNCHDGTSASDNIGTDLSNDHPVSFEYNSGLVLIDKGLRDPSSTPSGLGGTIEKDLLESGKLQCTSCHNPHHLDNRSSLKIPNEKSELCFKCHEK